MRCSRLLPLLTLLLAIHPAWPCRSAIPDQPTPPPNPQPEITPHYTTMLRYHRRMDANVPDRAVVIIGDSLVQGLCTDAIAQPSVNYGIGSDTTVGVLGRLATYQDSMRRASAVILAIGVNDMLHRDNPAILVNYRRILEAIPPGPAILCSAVLPINERTYPQPSPVRNARIQELNAGLRSLCAENPRWHFVDAGSRLVDGDGNLLATLEDGDGIHLNPAGNRLWIEALRKALRQASGTKPRPPLCR